MTLFPGTAEWRPRPLLMWAGALLLLVAIHTPLDQVRLALAAAGASATTKGLAQYKGLLFGLGATILAWPLVREVARHLRERGPDWRGACKLAALAFAGLAVLCVPFRDPFGLGSLGEAYGQASVWPFVQETGWTYRRLLMPALAHQLLLRGTYLYWAFSLALSFLLLAAVAFFLGWGREAADRGREALALVSLGTTSFVFFGFQNPGYPDALAYLLLLVAAAVPLSASARFGAAGLAMAAHEGSLFVLVPAALLAFPRGQRLHALALLAAYPVLWVASYGFGVGEATSAHGHYQGRPLTARCCRASPACWPRACSSDTSCSGSASRPSSSGCCASAAGRRR